MSLYSIGHSNASITDFLALLERFRIALLVDTRSKPYSRYNPHFSRQPLAQALQQHNIEYVFMGQELGGRPAATEFYFASGKVDYEQLAAATFYLKAQGIPRPQPPGLGEDERRYCSYPCSSM